MHDDEQKRREQLSALADGQLAHDELAQTMAWVAASQEARLTWHTYHVVGDALRSADLADCSGDHDFVARLREQLALPDAQTAVHEDVAVAAPLLVPAVVAALPDAAVRSANDAALRWKWLAVAASLMAVTVLGWHVGGVGTDSSAQLATAPAAAPTATAAAGVEPPVMLRDPRLDELLAAHRQFGGTSALQMPAGFLRNATFEQSGR